MRGGEREGGEGGRGEEWRVGEGDGGKGSKGGKKDKKVEEMEGGRGQHHVRPTNMFNFERKYLINRLSALEACNN